MAAAVRGHPPGPRERADPVRHLRARHVGARLRRGPGPPSSATGEMGQRHRALGRGARGRQRRAAAAATSRGFMEWAGRLERLAASPGTIARIFDLIGEFDVRDVLPSIRVPTLVMHRRTATPSSRSSTPATWLEASRGRATWSSRASDNMFSIGDSEALLGEIEEFLTGDPPRARARPHARHGAVHGHLRLHRAAPPSSATAAGASCSSATTRCSGRRSSATAAGRSSAPATASSPPSTARRGRSAARPRSPRRWARSGSRSGPGSTRVSWR